MTAFQENLQSGLSNGPTELYKIKKMQYQMRKYNLIDGAALLLAKSFFDFLTDMTAVLVVLKL